MVACLSLRGAFLATKQSSALKGRTMSNQQDYFVYIMTNWNNRVIYTGVTNNLARRVGEHKQKLVSGFTSKYNVTKLVYYEVTDSAEVAIAREKQIKGGSREKKVRLVNSMNPEWRDLADDLM
jgi:putative endonuclease